MIGTSVQVKSISQSTPVRYIKLGPKNSWFERCRDKNRVEFGHTDINHELAISGTKDEIAKVFVDLGRKEAKAKDFAREVVVFYTLGEDCLWITFAEGCLWWAFAEERVHSTPSTEHEAPQRYRNLIGGWSNLDINGKPLSMTSLSSALTKVSAYRQTLCKVEAADYLIRCINASESELIVRAKAAQNAVIEELTDLISELDWRDFEVLCDLIFSRSGWQRISELGGPQKDTDLVLEQVTIDERAFVQVKSTSSKPEFERYVSTFAANDEFSRMFYCCHSPQGDLNPICNKPVHVWHGKHLAKQAFQAGLSEWIIKKAS